ncbi:MAG: dCTP deaminase [Calditrichia bacterium]
MADVVDPKAVFASARNTISEKHQINSPHLDLTLAAVFRLKSGGSLDFGGSEYEAGNWETCLPGRKSPEDSYGWWYLHEGYYLLRYNEEVHLAGNQIGFIQPHPRLLNSGCFHTALNTRLIDSEFRIPLWVPKTGIRIKENARISQLLVLQF